MTLASCHRRPGRPAGIGLFALLALGTVLLLFVWVVFSGQTRYQRELMQVAADAAALAAAEELVDDCWLSGNHNEIQDTLARARRAAADYAGLNPIQGKATPLRDNPHNNPDGDVCFGHYPLCAAFGEQRFIPGPTFGPGDAETPTLDQLDAVRVVICRDKDHDARLRVVASPAAPDGKIDGVAAAVACLDRYVYGFRPTCNQTVPFVPLALASGNSADCWEAWRLPNGGNDQYSFDRDAQKFKKGADGIPEITVRIGYRPNNDRAVNALLVRTTDIDLTGDRKLDADDIVAQFATGLREEHLDGSTFGGALALGEGGTLAVDATDDIRSKKHQRQSLRKALKDLANDGGAVVFPLYRSQGKGPNSAVLCGFVAARVIDVKQTKKKDGGDEEEDDPDDKDGDKENNGNAYGHHKSLVVVLQPAMISVPAAMTDACRTVGGEPIEANPYIAKVRLAR